MSKLDAKALARECTSPLFWRRQTAQRLLVERGFFSTPTALRALLSDKITEPASIITVLHTLDQLGVLLPRDVQPFISHTDATVRIHGLQLSDRWLAREEGRELLEATLAGAKAEQNTRVLIQFALTLGEARDTRAFAALARLAREQLDARWMDAAILSGLSGRSADMLSELLREPGNSAKFLPPLAQAIAARRDEAELARTLKLLTYAKPETQSAVLDGLAKGRKNAPRKPLADKSARATLTEFTRNSSSAVSNSASALAATFVATVADDEPSSAAPAAGVEQVSDEIFRKFIASLSGPRDLKRGHELYLQACAACHRIGNEGFDVGPDLLGQLGMAEESLLKDILMPNERIRPGYETTEVRTRDGSIVTGLLKDDGATSLTLAQAGGGEQVLLRKDVSAVRRLTTSLMPPFAEGLTPADVANVLAWLRSNLGPGAGRKGDAPVN